MFSFPSRAGFSAIALCLVLSPTLPAQIAGSILKLNASQTSGVLSAPYNVALGVDVSDVFGNFGSNPAVSLTSGPGPNQVTVNLDPSKLPDPVTVFRMVLHSTNGQPDTDNLVIYSNNPQITFATSAVLTNPFPNNTVSLSEANGQLSAWAYVYSNSILPVSFGICSTVLQRNDWSCAVSSPGPVSDWLSAPGSIFTTGLFGGTGFDVTASPVGLSAGAYQGLVLATDATTQHVQGYLLVNLINNIGAALPHIAVGGTYVTGITAVNTGSVTQNVAMNFYGDNGKPLAIPVGGYGTVSTVTLSVPPGGETYVEAGTSGFPLTGGWASVAADPSVVVSGLFRNLAPNGQYYEASVPEQSLGLEAIIPFDATTFSATGAQIYTGFALANIDPNFPANVTCAARNAAGTVIPNAITVPQIPASGHWANYLFPALNGLRGTIDCTSDRAISAVGLRFLGNNAFSSLPVTLR